MQGLRYVVLSLVLGGLSVWGSENFFWIIPQGIKPLEFVITVIAYAIAAAVAVSAVIWSGLGGLRGAFLGGAIVGYMSEGVIVGTIYSLDPPVFYLVWTPLAWHALLMGAVLVGLGRAVWSPGRRVVLWGAVGLFGAAWAQYWPSERALPDLGVFAVYLLGLGLLVPLAHVVMDRMGEMPRPASWVLWVAPGIAALVWLAQGVADMNPVRLVLVVILGVILWVMRRLGGAGPVRFGPKVPVWHHLLFLIAPSITVGLAPQIWAQGWGTLDVNVIVAAVTCLGSVLWLGRLVWSAAQGRQGRA